jgi:hypothetical protein
MKTNEEKLRLRKRYTCEQGSFNQTSLTTPDDVFPPIDTASGGFRFEFTTNACPDLCVILDPTAFMFGEP